MSREYRFTAVIERDLESGVYIGTVPDLPAARTHGDTLDELEANLKEVIELCLEEEPERITEFVGILEVKGEM